jgi:hypothetical protein
LEAKTPCQYRAREQSWDRLAHKAKLTYSIGRQEALSPGVAERSARFDGFDPLCRRFARATSASSAQDFVIVEIPDTFVGVRLFIVSNLPLAVQLPYFNLIFIRQGRRNEMTLSRIEGRTEIVWLNNHQTAIVQN